MGLKTDSHFLTVEELNRNEVGTGGWINADAKFFQRAGHLMLLLVNEKLKVKVGSPITYWKDLERE
jgi:hypothetical protein